MQRYDIFKLNIPTAEVYCLVSIERYRIKKLKIYFGGLTPLTNWVAKNGD